eukprot:1145080-Pelagomonas_calceolata.AAC.6
MVHVWQWNRAHLQRRHRLRLGSGRKTELQCEAKLSAQTYGSVCAAEKGLYATAPWPQAAVRAQSRTVAKQNCSGAET